MYRGDKLCIQHFIFAHSRSEHIIMNRKLRLMDSRERSIFVQSNIHKHYMTMCIQYIHISTGVYE